MMDLKQIGTVVSEFREPRETEFACEKGLRTESVSRVLIDREFREGLEGLGEFSHAYIIYLLDRVDRVELTTYPGPRSVRDLPRVGLFASRSQFRPNPIALRLVELVSVEEDGMVVRGLDAVNGSPVLDVKPYVPGFDRPSEFRTAPWYWWQRA
jgi:tRNA-Thr(GGU) m(6)t(6)A37 methyltransferase TsaA